MTLTPQQEVILAYAANGLDNNEIASRLHLQTSTINTHMRTIFGKLVARNRTQAVTKALHERILTIRPDGIVAPSRPEPAPPPKPQPTPKPKTRPTIYYPAARQGTRR